MLVRKHTYLLFRAQFLCHPHTNYYNCLRRRIELPLTLFLKQSIRFTFINMFGRNETKKILFAATLYLVGKWGGDAVSVSFIKEISRLCTMFIYLAQIFVALNYNFLGSCTSAVIFHSHNYFCRAVLATKAG